MVEFALVLPILLMLFLAVGDFGRVFAAGVTLDAATRDAAESAASQYIAKPPGPLDAAAPLGNQPFYDALHAYAAGVVCAELRGLPNTTYDAGTQTCRDTTGSGVDIPIVVACVHDGADGGCATLASPGAGGIPSECTGFSPSATNSQNGTRQRWVEIRTCYPFTPILRLSFLPIGEIWLQRVRTFTIPCYFVLGSAECG